MKYFRIDRFTDCKQVIDSSFTEAVNYLLDNFENEMFITHTKEPRSEFDRHSLTVSDDSSLSFSLTQTAFLFVGQVGKTVRFTYSDLN